MNLRTTYRKFSILSPGVAWLALAIPLAAQVTSGNLTGVVYDPSGASIPGADVTVTNSATGAESSAKTTSAGEYRFENLTVGVYEINVARQPVLAKARLRTSVSS